jgi:4-carboxymuconolactone decarboxylase
LARIPLFPEAGLNAEQQAVYDKIMSGPRGTVIGPLRAALHSPVLADRWQVFGEFLRYQATLDIELTELAILVCGRHWNSELEWFVHSEIGLQAGLPESVMDAIRSCNAPAFETDQQEVVYEFARQLNARGQVDDETYDRALELFGEVALVELTAIVGYYTMVAMTTNVHDIRPPDPNPPSYRVLDADANAAGGTVTSLPPALARPTKLARKA